MEIKNNQEPIVIKNLFNWLFNPCKHQWEKIDENSFVTSHSCGEHIRFYDRKKILLSCKTCGKLTTRNV